PPPKCSDDSATEPRRSSVWLAPFRLLWSWLVGVCRALGNLGTAATAPGRAPLQAEASAARSCPAKPATKTNMSDALGRQLLTLLFSRKGGQIVVEQDVEQACEAYLRGRPWNSAHAAELIVMRGPPGVGKSTRAREILSERLGLDIAPSLAQQLLHICSTDDFFTKFQGAGQVYTYDKSKLGRNHAKNQERVKILTRLGVTPILVDNTNMSRKEMSPYLRLAQEAGYRTQIVEPSELQKDWKDLAMLLERNRRRQ
ncbi:N4BP2L2, partial [Symbiodinium sp. CCMP2456]